MQVDALTGQDLAYWVSRANAPQDANTLRLHYGDGTSRHEPAAELSMRNFVSAKFGKELPCRANWQ